MLWYHILGYYLCLVTSNHLTACLIHWNPSLTNNPFYLAVCTKITGSTYTFNVNAHFVLRLWELIM